MLLPYGSKWLCIKNNNLTSPAPEPTHCPRNGLLKSVAQVFGGVFGKIEMVLICAHEQLRLPSKESAISYLSPALPLSSGHHHSCQEFFFPLQSIFHLRDICLQLHLGHWSLGCVWRVGEGIDASWCSGWGGGGGEHCFLLVSFSFRGSVSQGFSETALLAFAVSSVGMETCHILCRKEQHTLPHWKVEGEEIVLHSQVPWCFRTPAHVQLSWEVVRCWWVGVGTEMGNQRMGGKQGECLHPEHL